LTLDENYDSTTQIRRLTINSLGWIGIGLTAARIRFTDAATDLIEFEDCEFQFNTDGDDFDFIVHGTAANLIYADAGNNTVGIGRAALNSVLAVEGSIKMKELAAAVSDTAAYGQLWVKNTAPCQLWFTDDAGTDTQLV